MRAREFTINIPINVKINDDNEIDVSTKDDDNVKPLIAAPKNLKSSKVVNKDKPTDEPAANFVPPLQQKIEIMKHAAGKESDVIDQLIADEDTPAA